MSGNTLRKELAFKYIRGEGIEVGALHQPLDVPSNVRVNYVDRLDREDILEHYPEISGDAIINPDIIDDAQDLKKIKNSQFDFCIANHVLEHMRDPIGAINNWLRILKPGGILFLSVPDVNNPLDSGRVITSLEHLYKDTAADSKEEDYNHFLECAKHWNKIEDPVEIERIAAENYKRQYSIHYHTFNKSSLEKLFSVIASNESGLFNILGSFKNEINGVPEYIYILEKDGYLKNIIELLQSSKKEVFPNANLDVIVPVYNAYVDLLRCLYSLLKNNDGYRVILLNDKSTDERIGRLFFLLNSFSNETLKICENQQNYGFVRTVNIGMKYSKKDIILLNSDTIVTAGWSGKIKQYAYKNAQIATVTPLTNNGTICSVPEFLKENEVPAGFTIDEFAHMIEEISLDMAVEIPTAVGFCMFIKRSVLDEIGLFDEETYGMGYSEENDFSRRAISQGYVNVICDNTYIYHRGSSSFSSAKREYYDKNLKLVSERYPDYLPSVSQFCSSNPLIDIHLNIKTRLKTWGGSGKERRILILLHSLGGGTAKYTIEMIDALKKNYIFYVLQVSGDHLILEEINNNQKIKYAFNISKYIDISVFHDSDYKNLLKRIIRTFGINLIHINHLFGHTLDIFEIAREDNIPIILTINDYYIICPLIFLVNEKGTYCRDLNNFERCDRCIKERMKKSSGFINQWRHNFGDSISHVSKFVSHNYAVFKILRKSYDLPEEKLAVIEPGHVPELIEMSRNRPVRQLHDPLCIAYIGVLDSSHKGMNLFYSLSRSPVLVNKVKWKIVGISDLHKIPGYYADYNVFVYGKFKNYTDLSMALADVDIVINLSLCETYAYTISEAWAMGLPVLTSDIGVPKARVDATGGGWTVDVESATPVEDKILEIINSPTDYQDKLETVSKINLNTMEGFTWDYMKLYESIPMENICYGGSQLSAKELFDSIRLMKSSDQSRQDDSSTQSSSFDSYAHSLPDPRKLINSLPIHYRFIKCFRENGSYYTIQRSIVYMKNCLGRFQRKYT